MTPPPDPRLMRSPEELRAAIDAFTDLDWERAEKIAAIWAWRRGVESDDLLQTAIERILAGNRRCPVEVPMMTFLSETMRSISSDDAKARSRRREIHLVTADGELIVDPPDDGATPAEAAEDAEERVLGRARLLDLFEDDLVAQTIVEGIMDGMEGEELRALTELDLKGFASKRRLIKRRIARASAKERSS